MMNDVILNHTSCNYLIEHSAGSGKTETIYIKQEHTKKAIYLIIDNGHKTALDHFVAFYNNLSIPEKAKIEYIVVGGTPKKSASKA